MNEDCDSTSTERTGPLEADPEPDSCLNTVANTCLTLEIVTDAGIWPDQDVLAARAREVARAVAAHLVETEPRPGGAHAAEAALVLTSDANIQALNRTYRNIDKPTNVLSFPADTAHQPPGEPMFLGDIAIAEETLAREAGERGISVLDHFTHLTIHGLLHLFGHDHEDDAEAEHMEACETQILATFGIADPYTDTIPEFPEGRQEGVT